MADFADVASTLSEQDLDHALANIKHFDQVSNYECEDCGA
ncbi:TPA: TraR/DksA family transcriptional regulator, partial [Acinetobacter baumannii]|nr:TraR/DksA family transcriptional regulator [Acinetobacter baumannii]